MIKKIKWFVNDLTNYIYKKEHNQEQSLQVGGIMKIINKIKRSPTLFQHWTRTEILIVDEVSMLSVKLFLLLDKIGRELRHCDRPFGGIQIIFSGDFYQLPPVGDSSQILTKKFCFECKEWNQTFHPSCQIQLKKIYRQMDDVFSTILNQIREGCITRSTYLKLMEMN